jgi:hypothetical protein
MSSKIRVRFIEKGFDFLYGKPYKTFEVKALNEEIVVLLDDNRISSVIFMRHEEPENSWLEADEIIALKRILRRFKVRGE